MLSNNSHLQSNFFLLLLAVVLVLTFFIFKPYVNTLVIAGVFAVLFRPLHLKLEQATKNRGSLAALLTVLIVVALIITPLTFFLRQVFNETFQVYNSLINGGGSDTLWRTMLDKVFQFVDRIIPNQVSVLSLELSAREYIKDILSWFIDNFAVLFTSFAKLIIMMFIWLLAFYYFLKDGRKLKEAAVRLSPLADNYDLEIFSKLKSAINSVIRGSLVIAIIQGVLAGVGFAIFDIPNPALWGSAAMISALIPGVGTALVVVPAIFYLVFTGTLGNALGLAIWGLVLVGMIDNFLRPYMISGGIKIHPLLVLLSVLGGISFFGPVGFITGPLILSLLFALINIYKVIFLDTSKTAESNE